MRTRYYYNPLMKSPDRGGYSVEIWMDRKGYPEILGTVKGRDHRKTMANVCLLIGYLNAIYGRRRISERTVSEIRELVGCYSYRTYRKEE